MQFLRHVILSVALSAALPLCAGPWPRQAGSHFASVATRLDERATPGAPRVRTSLFHDFGLTDRAGLVLEIDLAGGTLDKALAFYQLALTPPDSALRLSAALGGGSLSGDPAISPRLMLGHGFDLFGRAAWAETAASAELNLATGTRAGKLDLTLGIAPADRVRSYVQLFSYQAAGGDPFVRLESSTAFRVFGDTWIDAGISTGITPITDRRYKIGVWTSF